MFTIRNTLRFRKLAHASVLLLAAGLMIRIYDVVDGTEFMGGTVTGPIYNICGIAIVAFAVAIVLAYPLPRIASAISLLASLLSLPILLYFIAPGPFRAVFRGEYSVPLQSNFDWDRRLLGPAAAILILAIISVWNLFPVRRGQVGRTAEP